jgi:chromate reductase
MTRVLAVSGSLRAGSHNTALLRAAVEAAPEGVEVELLDPSVLADLPLYDHDLELTGTPEPVVRLREAWSAADAILFATPEYNGSIPGGLKNAIDWASRMKEQPFAGKPVALQSAAGGLLGGARMQYHLRQSLISLDVHWFGRPEVIVSFAAQKFDAQTLELKDQTAIDMIKAQLVAFEKYIRLVKAM